MRIERIQHDSPRYFEMVDKREEWLRKPLGLDRTDFDLAGEAGEIHLAAMENKRVVGVLLLRPLTNKRVKMRQVAVDPSWRGRGLGEKMVRFSEEIAKQEGFSVMECNARQEAVPFYAKLGYAVVSEVFEELGIPHFQMEKAL